MDGMVPALRGDALSGFSGMPAGGRMCLSSVGGCRSGVMGFRGTVRTVGSGGCGVVLPGGTNECMTDIRSRKVENNAVPVTRGPCGGRTGRNGFSGRCTLSCLGKEVRVRGNSVRGRGEGVGRVRGMRGSMCGGGVDSGRFLRLLGGSGG